MASTLIKMEPAPRDSSAGSTLTNNHTDHATYTNSGFAGHSRSPSDGQGGSQASPVQAAHAALPHGYTPNEAHIHPELRSGVETAPPNPYPPLPVPNMMPAGIPPSDQTNAMSASIGTLAHPPPGLDNGDGGEQGRKAAKRELSTSKRAAQNRAAQRAFRQRKEGYIKKLEQQVREYAEMEASFKSMQTENYALRDYVLHLQARLLETQGEFPQPPPNINLSHPHAQPPPAAAPDAGQSANTTNPLEVAAQAVAGLSRSEHYSNARADDDARTAEEITRLADNNIDGLPSASM